MERNPPFEFREATPEERRRYYTEEWRLEDVPEFLLESVGKREFGFDNDGRGPRNRYNRFPTPEHLERYLHQAAPYAAYCSISYYARPEKREGYEKAELVFDLDAKDLPAKHCCGEGKVCATCLERAKGLVLDIKETLEGNLAIQDVYTVYSGRGYHLRILDEELMEMEDPERAFILDYVRGSIVPIGQKDTKRGRDPTVYASGYSEVFQQRFGDILHHLDVGDAQKLGLGPRKASAFLARREEVTRYLQKGIPLSKAYRALVQVLGGEKEARAFWENAGRMYISLFLDAKVTVDVKRILRLPSSLHSKVSMKCMLVPDLDRFDPLRDAVPRFVSERA
jgi:DNA primase small subunit